MLSKEEFIQFTVDGPQAESTAKKSINEADSALPEGFGGFGFDAGDEVASPDSGDASFARNLLIAAGFGDPEHIERSEVILSTDAAAKHLPDLVYYWPKSDDRPYQTLLFELEQPGSDILKTKLFNPLGRQQLLEDALSRFVQHTLRGFEKGGERRTASVRQGRQTETLCIISVLDDREKENGKTHLVCFGTKNKTNDSLETFHIREEAKLWEPQIRDDHLGKLYDRHFKKLASDKWQNAFISPQERKLARKLLDTCIDNKATEHEIEKSVVDLLEEIAGSYGLRRKGGKGGRRLKPFQLPKDHDIGSDPETRGESHNPFQGMTLRDEKNRLLGYIIYCLDEKENAEKLRNYLQANNRFHNVLVIYPDGDHAELELWQGKTVLPGKLLKSGAKYSGEGEVVNLLSRFFVVSKAKVKNPVELAEELAFRARYLRRLALRQLQQEKDGGQLRDLYNGFKEGLVHDQTEEEFADAFAQTLTYGLLAARWLSKEEFAAQKKRFTRELAVKHLPSTSPFLKSFFSTVLKASFESKLVWILEDIADLLDKVDIGAVFQEDNTTTDLSTDPVIHFYEPFLAEYDAEIKKARGVYYTPKPVVSFIVRSVDELLKDSFGLHNGLADTATWAEVVAENKDIEIPDGVMPESPFVQILDPATGTGTFLVEVVEKIYNTLIYQWKDEGRDEEEITALWNEYVPKHLLPRLYGFEIMVAAYAIAHLKIGLSLHQTGYLFKAKNRARIYLTNTLEESSELSSLFEELTPSLSIEAKEANIAKDTLPATVIIGNPPYAGNSANKGEWITNLLRGKDGGTGTSYKSYFKCDGEDLGERNPKYLLDDYVKFIRYGQWRVEKLGIGILSFITNNGFLDNPTFRGMRQAILETYNQVHILDLHGSMKKQEQCADGSVDENVFDIMQGVCIGQFIRSNSYPNGANSVHYSDCLGDRRYKYNLLNTQVFLTLESKTTTPVSSFYLYGQEDINIEAEYSQFNSIKDVMPVSSNGIKTHRDHFAICFDMEEALSRVDALLDSSIVDDELSEKYKLKNTRDWNLEESRQHFMTIKYPKKTIKKTLYRPLDYRYSIYGSYVMDWPRIKDLRHALGENICLAVGRQGLAVGDGLWNLVTVGNTIADTNLFRRGGIQYFPLFLYPLQSDEKKKPGNLFEEAERKLNFSSEFLEQFNEHLKSTFTVNKRRQFPEKYGPEDIVSYIYAVLHSISYRKRYQEQLKIDYPRIPFVSNIKLFSNLVQLGSQLSSLHLFEKKIKSLCSFPIGGDNLVGKVSFAEDEQKVWINKTQYFSNVESKIWEFEIGGYPVCQKWLKDRKKRNLTNDEIEIFEKIVQVISDTIQLMPKIDKVIEQHGGWPDAFVTTDQGGDS